MTQSSTKRRKTSPPSPLPRIGNIAGRDTFYRPEVIVIKRGPHKGTWQRVVNP